MDLEHDVVNFLTSKTGRRVIIPIATPLRKHLDSIFPKQELRQSVFPQAQEQAARDGATRTLSNQFHDLLVKAKLADKRTHKKAKSGHGARRQTNELSFHCFRHTMTSLLKNAGVSEAIAMDIIGHDSKEVSANYTHIDAAPLTFDLPESLIARIETCRRGHGFKTASEVVRTALAGYNFEDCVPVREPHRQISVRLTADQRAMLKRYSREKDASVGELLRLALENLEAKPGKTKG